MFLVLWELVSRPGAVPGKCGPLRRTSAAVTGGAPLDQAGPIVFDQVLMPWSHTKALRTNSWSAPGCWTYGSSLLRRPREHSGALAALPTRLQAETAGVCLSRPVTHRADPQVSLPVTPDVRVVCRGARAATLPPRQLGSSGVAANARACDQASVPAWHAEAVAAVFLPRRGCRAVAASVAQREGASTPRPHLATDTAAGVCARHSLMIWHQHMPVAPWPFTAERPHWPP